MILSQRDPRWSNTILGRGSAEDTIGKYGCLLTTATMTLQHGGINIYPDHLNQTLISAGRYVGNAPDIDLLPDNCLHDLFPGVQYIESRSFPNAADFSWLHDTWQDEYWFLIDNDNNPANGVQSHWVRWYSGHNDASMIIWNPWTGQQEAFSHLYGSAAKNVYRIVHYTVPNPTPPPPPAPTPAAPVSATPPPPPPEPPKPVDPITIPEPPITVPPVNPDQPNIGLVAPLTFWGKFAAIFKAVWALLTHSFTN